MTALTFFGAAGTVTGSRFILEHKGKKLLIDCGLFQGLKENRLKNWEPFPVAPAGIDRVLLTHAHIDHSGYIPRLCRDGFSGPIHCTHATSELSAILLRDSAHLQEEDAFWANKKGFTKHEPALPLYTSDDAERSLDLFAPAHYGEDIYDDTDIRIKFRDSGHILGSAFIDLKTTQGHTGRKMLFSGDLGRPDIPILKDPVQVYNVDYLILESTYGNRLHDEGSPPERLARIINESIDRGGVLVIPSFAVGRTQTLLYVIRELEEQGKIPSVPVFLDSPMALEAIEVFERRIDDQDLTSRVQTLKGKNIFHPRRLQPCRTQTESKTINNVKDQAIIISSSGMGTGGRILHHLAHRLPYPANTILFIGYQAEGTRGKSILSGNPTVKIHGTLIPIKAHIENFTGYSGHADYNEILAWLMGFNRPPEKTFIVHGEPDAASALTEKIRGMFGWDVVIPGYGDRFELDMGG